MTEQLDTSAAAIAALLERVDEWWDYDHGNIFKDVANLLPALSAELTALRAERDKWRETAIAKIEMVGSTAIDAITAERDAALARVEVLEKALQPFALTEFETTQDAWDAFRNEYGSTWVDFDNIDQARAAIAKIGGAS